jgi:hypothetical protein
MYNGSPASLNGFLTDSIPGANTFKSISGLNVDAILSLPMVPFGFGLRYETLSDSKSTNFAASTASLDTKVKFDRVALLVNYRVIDTLVYLGPIATFGISNSSKLSIECPGCTTSTPFNGKAGSASSYSIGLEGGAKLLSFRAGAELGYSSMVAKDFNEGGTVAKDDAGTPIKVEMNGVYAKILLGLGF